MKYIKISWHSFQVAADFIKVYKGMNKIAVAKIREMMEP